MAASRCPKCESTSFEITEGKVAHATFRMLFVQCASCGAVVGVTEFFNVNASLQKIAKTLGVTL